MCIRDRIQASNPWAVDVAGGVEVEGRPGIKDHDLMRSFIEAAHLAEDPDEAGRNDLQPEKTPEDERETPRPDRGEPSRA